MKKLLLFIFLFIVLSCSDDNIDPPDTSEEGVSIGVSGGEVISDDGIVKLLIPANALSSAIIINIEKVNKSAPINDSNINPIGDVYKLSPSGTSFSKPIEVVLDYSNILEKFELETVAIVHWDEINLLEYIGINIIDNKNLSFKINSFSNVQMHDFSDKIYKKATDYGTIPWRVHNWRWNIPIIKWYLEEQDSNQSILTLSNVESSLNVWDRETSSFKFERTYNKGSANIIFEELFNQQSMEGINCDTKFGAFFDTDLGYMCPNGVLKEDFTNLTENDQMYIYIASNNVLSKYPLLRAKIGVIVHEVGHALGLGHLHPDHDIKPDVNANISCDYIDETPIMAENCPGPDFLHEWDLMALYEHYEAADNSGSEFLEKYDETTWITTTDDGEKLFKFYSDANNPFDIWFQEETGSSCHVFYNTKDGWGENFEITKNSDNELIIQSSSGNYTDILEFTMEGETLNLIYKLIESGEEEIIWNYNFEKTSRNVDEIVLCVF